MSEWELLRCPSCGHERARVKADRWIMPCQRCGQEELELYDLMPVPCELEDVQYYPTEEGLAVALEERGDGDGVRGDGGDRQHAPRPRARAEAQAPAARPPVSEDMISIEPLLAKGDSSC